MGFGLPARALLIWAGILLLAMANGLLREAVILPLLDAPAALVLSGILLAALILAVAYRALPWFGRLPAAGYLAIGLGWL